jgi:hypothetical protein
MGNLSAFKIIVGDFWSWRCVLSRLGFVNSVWVEGIKINLWCKSNLGENLKFKPIKVEINAIKVGFQPYTMV